MEPKKKLLPKSQIGTLIYPFFKFNIVFLNQYVGTATFLLIQKNHLTNCDLHFYKEYICKIIFFVLLLVDSQNRKTKFIFGHLVYNYIYYNLYIKIIENKNYHLTCFVHEPFQVDVIIHAEQFVLN